MALAAYIVFNFVRNILVEMVDFRSAGWLFHSLLPLNLIDFNLKEV